MMLLMMLLYVSHIYIYTMYIAHAWACIHIIYTHTDSDEELIAGEGVGGGVSEHGGRRA
jgi:hypothetical protein